MQQVKLGSNILTPCGPLFWPVEVGLGCIAPDYRSLDPPPIHMGVVVKEADDPIIFEGCFPRARLVPLSTHPDYRVVNWLSESPGQDHVDEFVRTRLGDRYDFACYTWTVLSRWLKLPFPRIYNGLFTCWEIAAEFALWCGEPWANYWEWPLITDLLKAAGVIGEDNDEEKRN